MNRRAAVSAAACRLRPGLRLVCGVRVELFPGRGAVFAEVAKPEQHDLVIVSGVGSVWPLLRSHTLLNNLQPVMGNTPLVMFYPGRYDGQSLRLFGKIKSNNYYRAFKLVPQ